MSRRPRRNHTPAFKAKVALAAIKGDRTLVQLTDGRNLREKTDRKEYSVRKVAGRCVYNCPAVSVRMGNGTATIGS